jgi:hypothetical protein
MGCPEILGTRRRMTGGITCDVVVDLGLPPLLYNNVDYRSFVWIFSILLTHYV